MLNVVGAVEGGVAAGRHAVGELLHTGLAGAAGGLGTLTRGLGQHGHARLSLK